MASVSCTRRPCRRTRSLALLAGVALLLLVQTLALWRLEPSSSRERREARGAGGGGEARGGEEPLRRRLQRKDTRTPRPPQVKPASRSHVHADSYHSHRPKEKVPSESNNNENSVPKDLESDGTSDQGPRSRPRHGQVQSERRKTVNQVLKAQEGLKAQEVLKVHEAQAKVVQPVLKKTYPAAVNASVRAVVEEGGKGEPAVTRREQQCEVSGKEAISALSRARSRECRQKIVEVYCKHKERALMPERVPRFCPVEGKVSVPVHWDEVADLATSDPVRIAFVLAVHGRASRQFYRLFKAIYHTSHFYYIHVDQRSEFLHSQVLLLAAQYPNVRVTPWRMATIWGGASLLTMYLRSMEDLLKMADWDWDFFINLSAADYPIRTNEQLVGFLSKYRNMNFIKSHGRDTARFIRKQGLDRLFLECDTHMWRLGDRRIPEGVAVDGGSDWFLLNRRFVDYVVNAEDALVTSMKSYYGYTLLPAESFFHTVLQNSALCGTMVDNNLRVTNWNRKLGCKCQYKHIVDWCGCSPNDFTPTDLPRLQSPQQPSRPAFFARKFEACVSNKVVSALDSHLFGPLPSGTPGLSSYWESVWDQATDGLTSLSDTMLTHYHAFTRMGLKRAAEALQGPPQDHSCSYAAVNHPVAVYLYFLSDQFQGYLVQHQVLNRGSAQTETLETWVSPKDHYTVPRPAPNVSRLQHLEVGTDWDPKERLFRTWGSVLGPLDQPVAVQRWSRAQSNLTATVVWIDPTNVIAATYDVLVEASAEVTHYRPPLATPLRPGRWRLRVLLHWNTLGQTSFNVAPAEFYQQQPIQREGALRLHSGPLRNSYMEQSFHGLNPVLRLPVSLRSVEEAESNSGLVGAPLRQWIDSLLQSQWGASSVCSKGPSSCSVMATCHMTSWSSASPDPKSELRPPSKSGRIR